MIKMFSLKYYTLVAGLSRVNRASVHYTKIYNTYIYIYNYYWALFVLDTRNGLMTVITIVRGQREHDLSTYSSGRRWPCKSPVIVCTHSYRIIMHSRRSTAAVVDDEFIVHAFARNWVVILRPPRSLVSVLSTSLRHYPRDPPT